MKFVSLVNPAPAAGPAYWLAFRGYKILMQTTESTLQVPFLPELSVLGLPIHSRIYLGELDGAPCWAVDLGPEAPTPVGTAYLGLRNIFKQMDEEWFNLAGRAFQILNWDRTHRFCGRCGSPTEIKADERAKSCSQCGQLSFPRISPAVIVAITRGDRILLARGKRFVAPMYSVLAGFVEPGETFEECVQREVLEEVGVAVKNISYFASQPWPFPDSLMVGFTAEYAGGEFKLDENEIMDAGWFSVADFPQLPDKMSIARRLIDWFVDSRAGASRE